MGIGANKSRNRETQTAVRTQTGPTTLRIPTVAGSLRSASAARPKQRRTCTAPSGAAPTASARRQGHIACPSTRGSQSWRSSRPPHAAAVGLRVEPLSEPVQPLGLAALRTAVVVARHALDVFGVRPERAREASNLGRRQSHADPIVGHWFPIPISPPSCAWRASSWPRQSHPGWPEGRSSGRARPWARWW